MGTFKNPDVWKKNLAYQIGDFALYNGNVYMAIKPVPAGTEMSADYWYAFDEGAIVPTGEISITENGEVNVAQYATANVNVEGGGGSTTTDMYLWNLSEDDNLVHEAFEKVLVQTGLNELALPTFEEVVFTPITETFQGITIQGAKVEGVPCGAFIIVKIGNISGATFNVGYGRNGNVNDAIRAYLISGESRGIALIPVDGFKCVCKVVPSNIN